VPPGCSRNRADFGSLASWKRFAKDICSKAVAAAGAFVRFPVR
jgi:hypothetical protein